MISRKSEITAYVCVDVEASGPNPGQYSLLSLGAATIAEPRRTFYVEFQPVNGNSTPEAMSVNRLSLDKLKEGGLPPKEALLRFERWLTEELPAGVQPIFVAFNAPFDWIFVNDYFHRYLGRNPFGHKALDIKAFFMGFTGAAWAETQHKNVAARFLNSRELTHHALQDAIDEAEMFANMLSAASHNGRFPDVAEKEPSREGDADE